MEYDDKEAKIIENLDDGDAEEPTLHYHLAEAKGNPRDKRYWSNPTGCRSY